MISAKVSKSVNNGDEIVRLDDEPLEQFLSWLETFIDVLKVDND